MLNRTLFIAPSDSALPPSVKIFGLKQVAICSSASSNSISLTARRKVYQGVFRVCYHLVLRLLQM